MADIFQEVEEDLKRERSERLLKRFAPYLAGAVALILLATAGITWRNREQLRQHDLQANRYSAALRLIDGGNAEAAAGVLSDFAREADTGYAALSRLVAASVLADKGDETGALALLDALAGDAKADGLLREVAVIRALGIRLDRDPPAETLKTLHALLAGETAFRFALRELVALAHLKAGDMAAAETALLGLADDLSAPAALRARATELLATLKSD